MKRDRYLNSSLDNRILALVFSSFTLRGKINSLYKLFIFRHNFFSFKLAKTTFVTNTYPVVSVCTHKYMFASMRLKSQMSFKTTGRQVKSDEQAYQHTLKDR
ncbi:MAG TPA: hypothetical protein DCW74_10805 [Alteromonas australica]|uniref:Uncharacterized protein n=1 Tax=Alteromonas australica TaxID=589873 RepID=A0A358DY57_9ALTE|nr:hypothetical protein [Alteromonas sp.]HAU26484.1 hypothetical protein [Alteromonas australica]HAW76210.1 hypothetical protein [Alteromonas australica]HBU51117.1 hypothetical protein [Alteromonas australica]